MAVQGLKTLSFFLFLTVGFVTSAYSQCSIIEVSLEKRVQSASLILEGRVKDIDSHWNKDKTMIYTSNKIEVYKVFKGQIDKAEITVITIGGIIDDVMVKTSNLLSLNLNEVGVFFLMPAVAEKLNSQNNQGNSYEAFSSKQGFINYQEQQGEAIDLFTNYGHPNQLHLNIIQLSGQTVKEIKSYSYLGNASKKMHGASPLISDFFPETLSAGTKSRLTIRGKGFGTNPKVKFSNADDGGKTKIEPLLKQYISSSDVEIVVEVPENAGTGKIQVYNGSISTSSKSLEIKYAYSNVPESDIQARFYNQSGGGYTWQMHPDFDKNADAKSAFLRAFEKWRCSTLVNWNLGVNTLIDKQEKDNVNVIRFDRENNLPDGVLGTCFNYYSQCENGKWYVSELDIVFDDKTNWNYSTATSIGNRYDMETIALHELGHGQQLGHVINSKDLMHYSVCPGIVKRELNQNNLACANLVLNNSTQSEICNFRPMSLLTQDICDDISAGYFDFDEIKAYPNPFNSETQISYQIASETNVQAEIFDLFGNKLYTLANEIQFPGRHVYNLNGFQSDMSNGLYVFTLYLNGTLKTKKILKVNN